VIFLTCRWPQSIFKYSQYGPKYGQFGPYRGQFLRPGPIRTKSLNLIFLIKWLVLL